MGCATSKFDIPKGGDSSQIYTRLKIVQGANDRSHTSMGDDSYDKKRRDVEKEEACIDKESSSEGSFSDRYDGISCTASSPSFRVYCAPSPLDDESSEGDSNPEEIAEDPKMDFRYYNKGWGCGFGKTTAPSRKDKRPFRARCFRRVFRSA